MRVLNEEGCSRFRAWLCDARAKPTVEVPPPLDAEPSLTCDGPPGLELAGRLPDQRLELGRYLNERLGPFEGWGGGVAHHQGLWSTLALRHFDELCPPRDGVRRVLRSELYVPLRITEVGAFRTYYRHLLAGPYALYRRHEELARAMLTGPITQHPDIAEQVASRQEMIQNRSVIGLIDRLYFDAEKGRLRRGFSDRKRSGNLRRLIRVLLQLSLTYDLQSLDPESLETLLPPEFRSFSAARTA